LILWALLWNGLGGLSLDIFTKMTPAPGVEGGCSIRLSAVYHDGIGVLIGAPLGFSQALTSPNMAITRGSPG